MELLARFSNALLTSAESTEVLGGLRSVSSEIDLDTAGLLTANSDVKEDFSVNHSDSCNLFSDLDYKRAFLTRKKSNPSIISTL